MSEYIFGLLFLHLIAMVYIGIKLGRIAKAMEASQRHLRNIDIALDQGFIIEDLKDDDQPKLNEA